LGSVLKAKEVKFAVRAVKVPSESCRCGATFDGAVAFCQECGAKRGEETKMVTLTCPECAAPIIEGADFCRKCGNKRPTTSGLAGK